MLIVDPFEQLVTEAKDRLSEREGQDISWRELARRCGYDDAKEWGVFRNAIRPQRARRSDGQRGEGRRPNPEVVRRLARVLPVSELELNQAAAETAGYTVTMAAGSGKSFNYAAIIATYLDDPAVSEEEREERAQEVLGEVAKHVDYELIKPNGEHVVVQIKRTGEKPADRTYLREVGAAAREGDPELSDPR